MTKAQISLCLYRQVVIDYRTGKKGWEENYQRTLGGSCLIYAIS